MARLLCLLLLLAALAVLPTEQQRGGSSSSSSRSSSTSSSSSRSSSSSSSSRATDTKPKARDPDDELDPDSDDAAFKCPKGDGLYADPLSCKKFYLCGAWKAYHQACPPSLYFDDKLKFCTFKSSELRCGPIEEDEADEDNAKLNQENLPMCDRKKCELPNCWCSEDGTLIPGYLQANEVPQFVLLGFSGAVNELVFEAYKKVLGYQGKFNPTQNRLNPNQCGIKGTFFINHEYTNYAEVQWFGAQGHEIALHSITHRTPELWWTNTANYSDWAEEVIGLREIVLKFGNGGSSNGPMTRDNVIGLRAPYVKPGGDAMYEMAHDFGLAYDSSLVAPKGSVPYWPFTWDYRQPFDCSNQKQKTKEKAQDASDNAEHGADIIENNRHHNLGGRGQPASSDGRRKRAADSLISKDAAFDDLDQMASELMSSNGKVNRSAKRPTSVATKKASPAQKAIKRATYSNSSKRSRKHRSRRTKRNSPYLGRPLHCPTKPYPGLWEIPVNPLFNEFNVCPNADQCVFPSSDENDDINDVADFLMENFERHYRTNRAPFQLNFHVNWFTSKAKTRALVKFTEDVLSRYNDVYFVTYQQLVNWLRNPQTTRDYKPACPAPSKNSTAGVCNRPHTCVLKHYLGADNAAATSESAVKTDTRYMPVCHPTPCPAQYPWFGNHQGTSKNFKSIMQLVEDAVTPGTSN